MQRDFDRAARILQCGDELHLTADDVSLLTGHSTETVRQRKVRNFPHPLPVGRLLRWRLGDVRAWLNAPAKRGIQSAAASRGTA